MTALLLHTTLSVVLVGWAYMVTSRVPYRTGWIWAGSLLVVLVGYTALLARWVFEGSPARVQTIVGNLGGIVLAISAIVCFVLYGLVSRGPRLPLPAAGAARADVSGWAPRDEESVIAPDDTDDWDGSVIDVGTWPSGSGAHDAPRGGRYALASAGETDPPPAAPARAAAPVPPGVAPQPPAPSTPPRVPPPAPAASPGAPPATAVYQPVAPPPVAPSEWPTTSSADEDTYQPVAPRRALPFADDMGE